MSVATCNIAHILISLMGWTSDLHSNTLTDPRTFERKIFFWIISIFVMKMKKSNIEMELKEVGFGCV